MNLPEAQRRPDSRSGRFTVHDLHIGGCMACYACRGTGVCVQKDGMTEVLDAPIEADVIVLAAPVYF